MTTKIQGQLEIDHDRGVIYFHCEPVAQMVAFLGTVTPLRICSLPKPIPADLPLDITHMAGCSWNGKKSLLSPPESVNAELLAAARPLANLLAEMRPPSWMPDDAGIYAKDQVTLTLGDLKRAADAVSRAESLPVVDPAQQELMRSALQIAVDYYTLSATDFENRYPVVPAHREHAPCWLPIARAALGEAPPTPAVRTITCGCGTEERANRPETAREQFEAALTVLGWERNGDWKCPRCCTEARALGTPAKPTEPKQ